VDWGKGKLQQDLLQKPYDRFERMALSYGTILHPVQRNGAYFLINSVTVHELYFWICWKELCENCDKICGNRCWIVPRSGRISSLYSRCSQI